MPQLFIAHSISNISNGIKYYKGDSSINSNNYTFDGKYFENIEAIGVFPPIINLKKAIKQENKEEINECLTILNNQHPQLYEFMLKHKESFNNFFQLHNNALLTVSEENIDKKVVDN